MTTLDKATAIHMLKVSEHLEQRSITNYSLQLGNNCIWASWGSSSCPINAYYIFKDDEILDIQYD
jgi:hypothetical protein